MDVADAMTPREEVVTASLPGTRDDVLEHLRRREFSSVAVVKEVDGTERFRGLVSRETLIDRPDEDQLALLVEEVPTTTDDAGLTDLAALMRETGARRVPVVDDDRLEGIVTVTDVVRAIAEGAVDGSTPVGELATRAVNCVYGGTPLVVVERELSLANVPYGMVLDDEGDAVGIITDADLIAIAEVVEGETATGGSLADQDDEWMWEGIKTVGNRYVPTRNVEFPDGTAADHMTEDLVTVAETRTTREAARLLVRHDIEQLALASGGELVGVLRDVDLLEALA